MYTKLPQVISTYILSQNDNDNDKSITCFIDNAVVHDEGMERRGKKAIKEWIDESHEKYQYTMEVTGVVKREEDTIVTGMLTGNFDGSPVSLDYHFTLKDNKIAKLSILLTEE